MDSTLGTIAHGLDEARARIATTRRAPQAAASDEPGVRLAVARPERLEAEVAGGARRLAGRAVPAGGR